MKNFLKRYWLFIFLAALLILILFLKFFPRGIEEIKPAKPLILFSTEPIQGEHETIWTTYPIKFNFDQVVKKESLQYQVTPSRETFVQFENKGRTVAIYPQIGWKQKVKYQLTISQLESEEGQLIEPINYSFKITPPETHDVW